MEKHEWEAALHQTKDELLRAVATQPAPAPPAELPTHVLQHLARMAAVDKGYAWWAAHLYDSLGGGLDGMPERLKEHMTQVKSGSGNSQIDS